MNRDIDGVRFLHVKQLVLAEAGEPERFRYSHTIAYRIESGDAASTQIKLDRAYVHPNDNFSRLRGRQIAGGRLDKFGGEGYNVPLPVPTNAEEWHTYEEYVRTHF